MRGMPVPNYDGKSADARFSTADRLYIIFIMMLAHTHLEYDGRRVERHRRHRGGQKRRRRRHMAWRRDDFGYRPMKWRRIDKCRLSQE